MEIGAKLQKAREKKGITRKQLAEKVNISEDGLFKIEKGKRNPSFEVVRNIVKVLGISLDSLG